MAGLARMTTPRKKPAKVTPRVKAVVKRRTVEPEPYVFGPEHRAHELRLSGKTWKEIAEQTGYSSPVLAAAAVATYLQRTALEQSETARREQLQLELDRLDAVQFSWWAAALTGDEKAANVVLKVMAQRARLLGLEDHDKMATTTRTVIITGTPAEQVAQLRATVQSEIDKDGR